MADQKDKIIRYVTGEMTEDEEIAFEAEMAEDENLYLHVQLEQMRFDNIRRRVSAALEDVQHQEVQKKLETSKPEIQLEGTPGERTHFFLKKLKISDTRRWAAVAALMIGVVSTITWWWMRQPHMQEPTNPQNPLVITPSVPDTFLLVLPNGFGETEKYPPIIWKPDSVYVNAVNDLYERPKEDIDVATVDESPTPAPVTDPFQKAFLAYIAKDTAAVYAFYDQYQDPDDHRPLEWKARTLFEQGRFAEAAPLFARLKEMDGRENAGEWHELLCYAALYRMKKRDFDKIKKDVILHKNNPEKLNELLKKIH